MKLRFIVRASFMFVSFLCFFVAVGLLTESLSAQSAVGVVQTAIDRMVSILNVIIVGVMAWSGFLLARGDATAFQRIIYGIIGLVVLNSASVLIDFFR